MGKYVVNIGKYKNIVTLYTMSIIERKYNCDLCNYHSDSKQGFYQHKKTLKHSKNNTQGLTKDSQNMQKDSQKTHKNSQETHKDSQKTHKDSQINPFQCSFCQKIFTRINNKNRHVKKYCKSKKLENKITIINNITNITHNNNNNINNFLMINFEREKYMAKNYKKLLLSSGLRRTDILKNLIEHSTQLKKEIKHLQDFKVTNLRDNKINVKSLDNSWNTEFFMPHMRKECLENTEILEKVLKEFYEEEENPGECLEQIFYAIKESLTGYDDYINDIESEVYTLVTMIKKELKKSQVDLYNYTNSK